MRMAFGLAGLLIVLGVIVWVLNSTTLPHTQEVAKANKKAREQVSQWAGKDAENGMKASDSLTLNPLMTGGRLDGLLVTDIVAGGPMERYFGLRRNDTIIQIGPLRVRDMATFDDARVMAIDAYQRQMTLTVVRDGQEIQLPQAARVTPAPTRVEPPAAPPEQSPSESGPSRSPLRRQIEQIPGIPTH